NVEKVFVKFGGKAKLPCLPTEQVTRVFKLEWWREDKKLVEIEDERMTLWEAEPHIAFLPETGALLFNPAQHADTGEYFCVVNSQRRSDGIAHLYVQGTHISSANVLYAACCFALYELFYKLFSFCEW
ncbi:neural cell adhesion molecule L1.1-like protein, partial [Dinothrombium tinctorium]